MITMQAFTLPGADVGSIVEETERQEGMGFEERNP